MRRLPWVGVAVLVGASAVLLLAVGDRASAQPSTTSPSQQPGSGLDGQIQILGVDEAESDVFLEIAVPPHLGRLAAIEENFGVTDGGRLVDVAVTPVGTAADTVLVIDTSGSMRGSALAAAKTAASRFIEALPADARVGLISFGDTVLTHRELSPDRVGVLADLEGLTAVGEETILWDALMVAAGLVEGSESGQSSVVVLSDGDDTASTATPSDVVVRLGGSSTVLYALAIESPDTDLVALEETVDLVGGQFLATTDLAQLETLYTDVAGRLANRYRLRFTSAEQGSRTVVVSVAVDGNVATARTTIGSTDRIPESTIGEPIAEPEPGDHVALGAVTGPPVGRLADPSVLWIGLGSMFAAFTLAGLLLIRPPAQVRLDAAAGADRLSGINARMGLAADRLISRHDQGRRIDTRLEAADINLRPGEFVVAWLLPTAVAGVAISAVAGMVLGVLTVVGSITVVSLILRFRAARRRSQFADQLTETLGILASSLRAGQSVPRAIELVASEAPSPTAEQFHRISFEIRVGQDLTESIRQTARRMASDDLEWLAQAVDINRELGGDLTEILDNVAATIRERRTVARQISALSAEGRATAWVLLSMPIILFLFSWWRTPDSIETLISEPLGRVLLAVAVTGMTVGHLWIRQLIKLKY